MRKNMFLPVVALSLLLSSCTQKSPVGTWIQPAKQQFDREEGFVLYKDGTASSINMRTVVFETWEQQGDKLIIKGKNTGVLRNDFTDTMTIVKVTKDQLTLSQNDYQVVYSRKE